MLKDNANEYSRASTQFRENHESCNGLLVFASALSVERFFSCQGRCQARHAVRALCHVVNESL